MVYFAKHLRRIKYWFLSTLQEMNSYIWETNIFPTKYSKLKELKNIHKGKRCFIIATGPSITIEDLNKLKNEYTFSMNSICMSFKDTVWRPTYYGIQDCAVFEKLKDCIKDSGLSCVLVGDNLNKKSKLDSNWIQYPLNIYYHLYDLRFKKKYKTKFSFNSSRMVYDGFTITYSLIQIAVFMGFNEIYLLGADTNYVKGLKNHAFEHEVEDPTADQSRDRMIEAYKVAKEYTEKRRVKIYNATRGGMLEVFDRVNFDNILRIGM